MFCLNHHNEWFESCVKGDIFSMTFADKDNKLSMFENVIVNLMAVLGAYCFFENKPDALHGYYIEDSKQLSLF